MWLLQHFGHQELDFLAATQRVWLAMPQHACNNYLLHATEGWQTLQNLCIIPVGTYMSELSVQMRTFSGA